jgi:hypothetical protein
LDVDNEAVAREANKVPYDPKVHPLSAPDPSPDSVKELHKLFLELEARVKRLENRGQRQ